MTNSQSAPRYLLIVDIDGLRQDVFHHALSGRLIPNIAALLGDSAAHLNPVSPAPSITFCAQSTIFTGQHPDRHGIVGNQFFDRFGMRNGGKPRFYAFDVGDTLAYDDAVLTFSALPGMENGLVGQALGPDAPTLYEMAAQQGKQSAVVYHMVSRGAQQWIRPSLVDIARFTKGGGLIGLTGAQYDGEMVQKTLALLESGSRPDVLTVYFMGLDHISHSEGPAAQQEYLARVVDPLMGKLADGLRSAGMLENTLVAVVSDHGQIEVVPDDRHSLRLSFPFDREMGSLFDALGLDVHDKPGEGPNCDAVVASNGGLAQVYLRGKQAEWSDLPRYEEDVLPVARAFWEAHATGKYSQDVYGALSMVLARDVREGGWEAEYFAVTPQGGRVSIAEYLRQHPEIETVDAPGRLRHLAGPLSGDLVLVANYTDGFYFGDIHNGVHGGLHPQDSLAVASLGWLGADADGRRRLQEAAESIPADRRRSDGREQTNLADVLPVLIEIMGW